MARVFTRGFEDGATGLQGDLVNGAGVTNAATTLSFGDVRCISLNDQTNNDYLYAKIIPQIATYDLSEVYIRIYVKCTAAGLEQDIYIRDDQGHNTLVLRLFDGDVVVLGSLKDTLGNEKTASWVRWEFYVLIGASGRIRIRKEGAEVFDSGVIDTTGGTGTFVQWIGCKLSSSSSGTTMYFDDIAVNDTTGVVDVTYPGDARIIGLLPTAAGANTNMTPLSGDNYANVDDAQSSGNDGDTTYVSAAVSQELDSYEFESIATKYPSLPSNTAIARVTLMAVCRTPTTGLDIRGVVVDGGTENGVVVTPEGTASYGINGSVVTHPDGSWTYARVESAEFGIESI